MPVVCVDPASYADAGALMATVADGLSSTLTTLGGDLAGSGGIQPGEGIVTGFPIG